MNNPQNMSRKRPAPGTAPLNYQTQPQQVPPLTDDQFFDWGSNAQDPTPYPNQYAPNVQPQPSNQVARRPMTQVMNVAQPAQWISEPPQQDQSTNWSDDIDELVAKAQIAKKDSESRRKQIPPFVMKLHRLVFAVVVELR